MAAARRTTLTSSAEMLMPRVAHLESEMGEIKSTLSAMSDALNGISRAQAEMRAAAPAAFGDMLQGVTNMAWLFAMVIGGVIWVSSMVNQKPDLDLKERLSVIEYRLEHINQQSLAQHQQTPNRHPGM